MSMFDQVIRFAVVVDLMVNLVLHAFSVMRFCKVMGCFNRIKNQLDRVDWYTSRLYEESVYMSKVLRDERDFIITETMWGYEIEPK